MRTLIHCTAYAQSRLIWERRYRRWVDAIHANALGQQQILLVDDGSPVLPGWPDTDIVTLRSPDDAAAIRSTAPILLLRYADRLGRAAVYDFPGWHRSFVTGLRYAAAQGFEKLVHLESDAYLVSERMRDWVRQASSGWTALWAGKYDFPEIALQVIGPDQMAAAEAFARAPYDGLVGVTHETALPLTHIEKRFTGDRYGEDEPPVPADADFAAQVPAQREPSYYWWLRGAAGPAAALPGRVALGFGAGEAGVALLGDGWARPEAKGCWMVRAMSVLGLPPLPQAASYDLVLTANAHVQPAPAAGAAPERAGERRAAGRLRVHRRPARGAGDTRRAAAARRHRQAALLPPRRRGAAAHAGQGRAGAGADAPAPLTAAARGGEGAAS